MGINICLSDAFGSRNFQCCIRQLGPLRLLILQMIALVLFQLVRGKVAALLDKLADTLFQIGPLHHNLRPGLVSL